MIFTLLTFLSALALAGTAGWFSIIGIMSIYAGAPIHALIMGVVLESGKLVTTSWLYRNWNYANWKLKVPLIIFTLTLMLTTSIGVFGFLSKSHLEQGAKTVDNAPKVERLEQQIAKEKAIIADNEKVISQLDATINSYLGKDRTDKSVAIRRSQAPQRKQLKDEIDAANKRIDAFSDEKFKLQSEIRALEIEVGPVRYIAELIYGNENNTKNIEGAVKIFTLLIVSTLDPLAVILLVAANHTVLRLQNEKKEKQIPESSSASSKDACFDSGFGQGTNIPGKDEKVPQVDTRNKGISTDSIRNEDSIEVYEETEIRREVPETPVGSINEEESTILERFNKSTYSAPVSFIRSPSPSMVSQKVETETDNVSELHISVQDSPIVQINSHFIPQKVNEEEKIPNQVSMQDKKSIKENSSQPTQLDESQEVEEKTQAENQENSDVSKIAKGILSEEINGASAQESKDTPVQSTKKTYPKAFGWLTEFKRTPNE